ncbi:MAG: DUF3592 domain-containing protein [Candidatus Obscuribacterales bacterium]|nr:DUF3592 domain-containing protein [Candidatus Obscuribacterales bacterium]
MAQLSGRNIATLFIAIAIGAFAASWGMPDFLNAPEAKEWAKTQGKIVKVWEDTKRSNHNLFAAYDYEVAGEKFTSTQYRYKETEFPFSTKQNQYVDVYYLPSKPFLAVLDPAKPTRKFFTALILISFVSIGMIATVFTPNTQWPRRT